MLSGSGVEKIKSGSTSVAVESVPETTSSTWIAPPISETVASLNVLNDSSPDAHEWDPMSVPLILSVALPPSSFDDEYADMLTDSTVLISPASKVVVYPRLLLRL
ncbi:hypothetical protein [Halohasta salina]|uniref:hypothetical protein n=1 Tax=Halohasta salina TaxID=2961621 RepID=UPI0020A23BA2|nr:hypothetical protein [Halohasta salina]